MNIKSAIKIFLTITLLWIVFISCVVSCEGAENKKDNKNSNRNKSTSQMTSREIKIRNLQFKQCLQSGKNRSSCYYLYY